MIPRKNIDVFLEDIPDGWDWVKKVPVEELRQVIYQINPSFSFNEHNLPKLHKNQIECFCIAQQQPSFLFFTDMGGGKTRLGIEIIRYRKHTGESRRTLIVVKHLVHCDIWEEQLSKYSNLSYVSLKGGTAAIKELLFDNLDKDVFIISYPSLTAYLTKIVIGDEEKLRVIYNKDLQIFTSLFDLVIYDELHAIRKTTSKIFEVISYLSHTVKFKYGLTGTPQDKNPEDLWPMFYFMDKGETLGSTLSFYRDAFFSAAVPNWALKRPRYKQPRVYSIKKSRLPILIKKLKNKSIRHSEEELTDLPQLSIIDVPVILTGQCKSYYNDLIKKTIEKTNEQRQVICENTYVSLRRAVAGHRVLKENGLEVELPLNNNPKLDVLISHLESLENEKVLVYNEYISTGNLLGERFEKEKILYRRIYGGTKNQSLELFEFINDKKYKVLLLNTSIGSTGLDGLQNVCKYIFYYELPTMNINYMQSLKRIKRFGQTQHCFAYRLIAKHTIDERILQSLELGCDAFQTIIEDKTSLKEL